MRKNKRTSGGRWTMLAGLLLIAAALLLTAYNLAEQYRADASSSDVLSQLAQEIPEAEQAGPRALALTDKAGSLVAWPMDANGEPMPWPVDDAGVPVASVTDARGKVHLWKETAISAADDAQAWAADEDGSLLPWIKDAQGQTIAWPTDGAGDALAWDEIQARWTEIVLALLPYQQYTAEEEPVFAAHPDIEMPTEEIDGHSYIGVLEIPKLALSLPVMSDWSYPKFKIAPCRYVGSVYSGDIVIAAHNYDRHFGKIKTLEEGDEVRLTDVEGNVFNYEVSGFETLGKTDVEQMEAGEWDMTLFTCTPGGAKRVTVRCVQKSYLWLNREKSDEQAQTAEQFN